MNEVYQNLEWLVAFTYVSFSKKSLWNDKYIQVVSMTTIAINSLLIYIVHRYSRSDIGSYKYLILIFALFGMFYASINFIMHPVSFQKIVI